MPAPPRSVFTRASAPATSSPGCAAPLGERRGMANPAADLSQLYRRFADEEFRGRSPLYEELARGVADDGAILDFLLTLPREKRQPNLLLAALRSLIGTPSGWPQFRAEVLDNEERLRALMLARSTQTNEPARCASLLPVLARLPGPL